MEPSLRGRAVVATPKIQDANFNRTVVLLLEHADEGALGVVLNRPSVAAVAEVLPAWQPVTAEPGVLFLGGPVGPDSLIGVAHLDPARVPDDRPPVLGPLGTVDLSTEPAEAAAETVRIFRGYAGWDAGQLEAEIATGAWFVLDASPDDVLTAEPATLFRRILRRQGGRLALFANCPPDLRLN